MQSGVSTAIDLTLCSPELTTELNWNIEEDLHGSDHWPIIITEVETVATSREPRFKFKRANWNLFEEHTCTANIDDDVDNKSVDELVALFNSFIISAANLSIPKSSDKIPLKRVPWWNIECSTANFERKRALRRYQRSKTIFDKISYNRARANAARVKKIARRESWKDYVNSLTSNN